MTKVYIVYPFKAAVGVGLLICTIYLVRNKRFQNTVRLQAWFPALLVQKPSKIITNDISIQFYSIKIKHCLNSELIVLFESGLHRRTSSTVLSLTASIDQGLVWKKHFWFLRSKTLFGIFSLRISHSINCIRIWLITVISPESTSKETRVRCNVSWPIWMVVSLGCPNLLSQTFWLILSAPFDRKRQKIITVVVVEKRTMWSLNVQTIQQNSWFSTKLFRDMTPKVEALMTPRGLNFHFDILWLDKIQPGLHGRTASDPSDSGGSTVEARRWRLHPFSEWKNHFSVVYSRPNTEAFINSVLPFNLKVIPHMNTNLFVEIGVVGPKFLPLDNQVIQRPIASPSSHYDWLRLLVSWSWNFEINLRHITRTKCLWLHMLNYGQWPS